MLGCWINSKDAFQMITIHVQPSPTRGTTGAPQHQLGVGGQCKTEKGPRPTLAREYLKTSMFTFTDYGSGIRGALNGAVRR